MGSGKARSKNCSQVTERECSMERMKVLQTASKGYAAGPVYLVKRQEVITPRRTIEESDVEEEIGRYRASVKTAKEQLEKIAGDSEIFEAYIQLVQDEALMEGVISKIKGGNNAEAAVEDTAMLISMLIKKKMQK